MYVEHDAQPVAAWRPGVLTRLRAGAARGAASICIGEQWFQPGTGAPLHTHPGVEEVVTVLDGQAEFVLDGERRMVRGGTSVLLPADSVHGFRNTGAGVLHVLGVYSHAAPPTVYADDPDSVVRIAATDGEAIDVTRTRRSQEDDARGR